MGNNHKNKNNNNIKNDSNNKEIQRKLKIIRQESCGIICDIIQAVHWFVFFLCNCFLIGKNEKSCVYGYSVVHTKG